MSQVRLARKGSARLRVLSVFLMVFLVCTYSVVFGPSPSTGYAQGTSYTLEGQHKEDGWTTGHVKGWYELEWVPYRFTVKNAVAGTTYRFSILHDSLRGGVQGVDRVGYASVNGGASLSTDAADGYDSSGNIYMIGYWFEFTAPDDGDFVLSWKAHIAFGAHNFSGASLHTQASDMFMTAPGGSAESESIGQKDVPIDVKEAAPGSLTIYKEDSDGLPLDGAHFAVVVDDDGTTVVVDEDVTTSGGLALIDELPPGRYTVTETQSPSGYLPDPENPKIVIIDVTDDGVEDESVTFVNSQEESSLVVEKVDGYEEPLGGAVFALYEDVGVVGTYEDGVDVLLTTESDTDEDGTVEFNGLSPGDYCVVEVSAPGGYQASTDAQCRSIGVGGSTVYVTFTNSPVGQVVVTKLGSDTKPAHPIAEVGFELYADDGDGVFEPGMDDGLIDSGSTDASGELTFEGLAPGFYWVHEAAAPAGYSIGTDNPQLVEVEGVAGGDVVGVIFVNDALPAGIEVLKVEAGDDPVPNLLPGAVFQLFRDDGTVAGGFDDGDTLVAEAADSDDGLADGKTHFTDVVPGVYWVVEVDAPDGYDLPDPAYQGVEITVGEAGRGVSVTFENVATPGSLTVIKLGPDEETGLEGAVFRLHRDDGSGEFDSGDLVVGTDQVTDADGEASWTGLEPGAYWLEEVAAPAGYRLAIPVGTALAVTIEVKEGGDYQVLRVTNYPHSLMIMKQNDDEEPLDAGFQVYLDDGDELYEPGTDDELVWSGSTGADGTVTVSPIEVGGYWVHESSVPSGYLAPTTNPEFVTVDANVSEQDPEPVVVFTNYPQGGRIVVSKLDDRGDPVPGATFALYQGDEASGDPYRTETDEDNDGEVTFAGLRPGHYVVVEIGDLPGYDEDTAEHHVIIDLVEDGDVKLVEVTNHAHRGTIIVLKVDGSGKALDGAEFTVYADDGDGSYEPGGDDVKVEGSLPTQDGRVEFDGLLPGRYWVVESHVPSGYHGESPKLVTVPVEEDGAEVTVEFENDKDEPNPRYGSLRINKVDSNGATLDGATFVLWRLTSSAKTHWGADEYTVTDGSLIVHRMPPGTYVAEEVSAPTGYELADPAEQTVRVVTDETVTVEFINEKSPEPKPEPKYGVIEIHKVDGNGAALDGAAFMLWVQGEPDKTLWSESEYVTTGGMVRITGLPPGTYMVEEVRAPEGYVMADPAEQTVVVVADQVAGVAFVNPRKAQAPVPPLPNTGGSPLRWLWLGLVTLTIGLFVRSYRVVE